MSEAQIHVGDIGTVMTLGMNGPEGRLDLSNAEELLIVYMRPDASSFAVNATIAQDTKGDIMRYVTPDGHWDQSGWWRWQGIVTYPNGRWHGVMKKFRVYPAIPFEA